MTIYRATLVCTGVPVSVEAEDAACIEEEFTNRPHHQNVQCILVDGTLILTAENDYDRTGLALMDEFSDVIMACISNGFDGDIEIRSVIVI